MKTRTALIAASIAALIAGGGTSFGLSNPSSLALGPLSNILGALVYGHVANNAALAQMPVALGRVRRDGFAAAGDGGAADYTLSATPCAIAGGDSGAQVPLNGGGCAIADIKRAVSIKLWGAPDDDTTDVRPFLAAAFAALNNRGGGTLILPPTTSCYRLNTAFSLASAIGSSLDATDSCLDIGFASGDGLTINGGSNVLLSGMTLKHALVRTSGNDLEVTGGARNITIRNVTCLAGHWSCVGVDGGAAVVAIDDLYVPGEGQNSVCLGCENNGIAANVVITGGDSNFQHRAAYELQYASGVTIRQVNADFNTHGLWAHPGSGQVVNGIDTDATAYFDYSTQEGVLFDASQGGMTENRMMAATWIVSCGQAIPAAFASSYSQPFTTNPTAPCLSTSGTTTSLVNNRFDVLVFNAAGDGIKLVGGMENYFSGTTASNGAGCPSSSPCNGFEVGAGTIEWGWEGRAGGTTGIGTSSHQNYGVFVDGAISGQPQSDYFIVSGNLTDNVNGGYFAAAGTGTHSLSSQILQ